VSSVRYLRPKWLLGHVLVVVAVLATLRLGWWQLDRSESNDGSLQNLGYALLWPAFGVAFVVMWVKFLRLDNARAETDAEQQDRDTAELLAEAEALTSAAAPGAAAEMPSTAGDDSQITVAADGTTHYSGIVGDEDQDDPELVAYNRALAALAEEDRRARGR
jgi:DNA-binding transcriptional regulator of glucitol operon